MCAEMDEDEQGTLLMSLQKTGGSILLMEWDSTAQYRHNYFRHAQHDCSSKFVIVTLKNSGTSSLRSWFHFMSNMTLWTSCS